MLPDTFEQWKNERDDADLGSKSKEPAMGQKLEDTAKEAIVALETLKKHLDRLEEERTLYTAALLGMHRGLSNERPKDDLCAAAEKLLTYIRLHARKEIPYGLQQDLRDALNKVKS